MFSSLSFIYFFSLVASHNVWRQQSTTWNSSLLCKFRIIPVSETALLVLGWIDVELDLSACLGGIAVCVRLSPEASIGDTCLLPAPPAGAAASQLSSAAVHRAVDLATSTQITETLT